MAVKKISELDTKSFLGTNGAVYNSYVLINYAEEANGTPVTYKATINELGNAIVNALHLYKETMDGPVTTSVNSGSYVNSNIKSLLNNADRTKLEAAVSEGYVTSAINNAGGGGGGAPEGALYLFESNGTYIIGESINDSTHYDLTLTTNVFKQSGSVGGNNYQAIGVFDFGSGMELHCYDALSEDMQSFIISSNNLPKNIAYIDTSDDKPAIYNYEGTFQGFLSTT